MRSLWRPHKSSQEGADVSDENNWQSPSGTGQAAEGSPWSPPHSGSTTGTDAAPAWQQQPAPAVWAPPPKPGLIPLHPLSFGTIIGSSFRVMRRNPGPTFGISAGLYGFILIVYALLLGAFFVFAEGRVTSAATDDQNDILAGAAGLFLLLSFIPIGLAIAAAGIVQGILSLEVSRATLGERLKLSGLWRLARGRLGTLVLWALLTTAALVAFVVLAAVIATGITLGVTLASVASTSGSGSVDPTAMVGATLLSMGVTFVVMLGVLALSVWLGIKTALVPSIIVLERLGLFASIARSWRLTRNNFWRTFGIQALISVIVNVATNIVAFPLQIAIFLTQSLVNPLSDPGTSIIFGIVLGVVSALLLTVVGAIGLVMQSSSLALVYIDIRMRKEGLDLELLHYVEAKRTAQGGVGNPYEHVASASRPAVAQPGTGSPWA